MERGFVMAIVKRPAVSCVAWLYVMALTAALCIFPAQRANAGDPIQLLAGQQKIIKVSGLQRVAVGNPAVADVSVLDKGEGLLVVAKSAGNTDLTTWSKDGETHYVIEVMEKSANQILLEIKQLFGEMEGVELKIIGGKVAIRGKILTQEDLEKIGQVMTIYGAKVVNLAKPDARMNNIMVEQINASLLAGGHTGAKVKFIGKSLMLEGVANDEGAVKRAYQIASALAPDVVNMLKVGSRDMIVMDVHFMEVRKSNIQNIGIKWQEALNMAGVFTATKDLSGGWTGNIGIVSGLAGAIKLQSQKGEGRVLANPKLVAQSGTKAEFLAGGEIPISLITANSSSVVYKKYGIILNIKPTYDGDMISSDILVEVSTLDPSVTVGGVPGFLTRQVNTSITVKIGESIVLGGFIDSSSSKDVAKVPGIGNIPIIGELFKSRGFQDRDSELLVFVTPQLSTREDDKKQIKTMQKKYDDKGEDVKAKFMD